MIEYNLFDQFILTYRRFFYFLHFLCLVFKSHFYFYSPIIVFKFLILRLYYFFILHSLYSFFIYFLYSLLNIFPVGFKFLILLLYYSFIIHLKYFILHHKIFNPLLISFLNVLFKYYPYLPTDINLLQILINQYKIFYKIKQLLST